MSRAPMNPGKPVKRTWRDWEVGRDLAIRVKV
jgi:hypothetical protein